MFSVYIVPNVYCSQCILFSMYIVLNVYCSQCTLYIVLNVHCTLFSMYIVLNVLFILSKLGSFYRDHLVAVVAKLYNREVPTISRLISSQDTNFCATEFGHHFYKSGGIFFGPSQNIIVIK